MKQVKTEPDTTPKWLEEVIPFLKPLMMELHEVSITALEAGTPYHSVRIAESYHTQAGRTLGWCISAISQVGWEHQSTTCDRQGTLLLMFKNPYVFS